MADTMTTTATTAAATTAAAENGLTKIVLDCFGGDHSPEAQVKGGVEALRRFPDLYLIFSGDEEKIRGILGDCGEYPADRSGILHAPDVVGCDEKPTDAIRLKKESSMMKAVTLLREDDAVRGIVSFGSSGALVAAGTLRIGRLRGVMRPPFCPVLPTMNGGVVGICDSGANVDCPPEYLQQFAIMSSLYMEKVYGVVRPRVALLNVGVEAGKGDELRKQAYDLLSMTPGLDFVGNMESRDLLSGRYDVVVCDGFAGNVLIKSTEGTAVELLKKLKADIMTKFRYKMGALLMKSMFESEKEFMNYQNYGGSILLGTKKIIVKGHGSSKETAVIKCIEQALRCETGGLNEAIETSLDHLNESDAANAADAADAAAQ